MPLFVDLGKGFGDANNVGRPIGSEGFDLFRLLYRDID